MSWLRRARPNAFGLAIQHRFIGAVQVLPARAGERPTLLAASRIERSNPGLEPTAEELGRVAEALWRQGFVGSDVVLQAPQEKLLTGVFDIPPRASGAPIGQIARNELARAHKLEPSQLECGWWELPPALRETDGSQAIVTGCRTADAEALLEVCGEAGLNVRVLDAPGPALTRAALCGRGARDKMTAALEIGSNASLLVVIRSGSIVYQRVMEEAGLEAITAPLCRKLAIDHQTAEYLLHHAGVTGAAVHLEDDKDLVEEARLVIGERIDELAAEVRASAAYAGRKYGDAVELVLVTGEGASVPGLTARLGQRAGTETEVVSPRVLFEVGPLAEATGMPGLPELTLAAGLSLHREAA